MAEESLVTSEIKKLIGVTGKPYIVEVEKRMIRNLAKAIGDDNPLWQDEEFARKTKYGELVSPPAFSFSMMMVGREQLPDIPTSLPKKIEAGGEWELLQPIKAGDKLTVIPKLADAYEKSGKQGRMLFLVYETTLVNQRGEVAGKSRSTFIRY